MQKNATRVRMFTPLRFMPAHIDTEMFRGQAAISRQYGTICLLYEGKKK